MKTALPLVLVVIAAATAGQAMASPGTHRPTRLDLRPAAEDVPGTTFTSFCRFSHRNLDDMIVSPGKPRTAHDHTYLGNVSTNAHSTLASLLRAGTTCHREADTAAYWVPTLFNPAGKAVKPSNTVRAVIYYRRRTVQPASAFPPVSA
jgi:hypothetical protein